MFMCNIMVAWSDSIAWKAIAINKSLSALGDVIAARVAGSCTGAISWFFLSSVLSGAEAGPHALSKLDAYTLPSGLLCCMAEPSRKKIGNVRTPWAGTPRH